MKKNLLYVLFIFSFVRFIGWIGGVDLFERSIESAISVGLALIFSFWIYMENKDKFLEFKLNINMIRAFAVFLVVRFVLWIGGVDFTERSIEASISFVVSSLIAIFTYATLEDIKNDKEKETF